MSKLRYSDRAKQDMRDIRRFIANESGERTVAYQFSRRLDAQCRRLAELPGTMGRARPELREKLRSIPFGNYVIFFMYNDDLVKIVSIIEGHRDLGALFDN